jgi:hypothetical protein
MKWYVNVWVYLDAGRKPLSLRLDPKEEPEHSSAGAGWRRALRAEEKKQAAERAMPRGPGS